METIRLVAFGDVSELIMQALAQGLRGKFGLDIVAGPRRPLPVESFDARREQFPAGIFLGELRNLAGNNGDKLLGVTDADLYSAGLTFVFGQAEVGGQAAIISLARLQAGAPNWLEQQPLLIDRALKEAVHELGHNHGLDHCRDKRCVMHFSNGLADTDFKSADFCARHLAALGR